MDQAESSSKSKDGNDKFPLGMRVLAVDDDKVCLKVLEGLLLECGYKVTVAQHAHTALQLLRENKDSYDLVISDVKMPDMDGFKLLEIVGLEMDLPVIMLSVDSEVSTVMKGIMHGACDYLVKPVRLEELKIIWKHVVRKSLHDTKEANDTTDKHDRVAKPDEDHTSKPSKKSNDQKRDKEDEATDYSDDDLSAQKRPRVAWSAELHSKFINAVNQLGLDRAVPKRILDLMDVPGLTRENVASHLQKYRKALKKNSVEGRQQFDTGAGSSGFGANAPSSRVLSFNSQGPHINTPEGYRGQGYQIPHRTMPFGQAEQPHNGYTRMTSTWGQLPLNHQNNLSQQYESPNQASQFRGQSYGYIPNPSGMQSVPSQSAFRHASFQSLTPRPHQPTGYMENSSQNFWASNTSAGSTSVTQPGSLSNQHNVATFFGNTNSQQTGLTGGISAGLDTMLHAQQRQHPFNARGGASLELGSQNNGDPLNVQGGEQRHLRGVGSPEMATHPMESSSAETMFNLSNSESPEDLHTVLKQFQP